jgi:hypothetical protein
MSEPLAHLDSDREVATQVNGHAGTPYQLTSHLLSNMSSDWTNIDVIAGKENNVKCRLSHSASLSIYAV